MVLYPSLGLCAPSLEDPDFAAGFARLYNSWIADCCASSGGRLRGVAVVPIEHGKLAIDVMTEAKELGVVATLVPPALKTRNLDHPDLDPFYAAAVELAMPLGIHGVFERHPQLRVAFLEAGAGWVRQRLPALGRRMAGEHQASANPRGHQRGGPGKDRRVERPTLLRAELRPSATEFGCPAANSAVARTSNQVKWQDLSTWVPF